MGWVGRLTLFACSIVHFLACFFLACYFARLLDCSLTPLLLCSLACSFASQFADFFAPRSLTVLLHTGFAQMILDKNCDPTHEELENSCSVLNGRDERLLQWITESGLVSLVADNVGSRAGNRIFGMLWGTTGADVVCWFSLRLKGCRRFRPRTRPSLITQCPCTSTPWLVIIDPRFVFSSNFASHFSARLAWLAYTRDSSSSASTSENSGTSPNSRATSAPRSGSDASLPRRRSVCRKRWAALRTLSRLFERVRSAWRGGLVDLEPERRGCEWAVLIVPFPL